MFNLKEVSEEVKSNDLYITPGVKNRVVISKWVSGKSSNKGTPFIGVQLVTVDGKAANVEPRQFDFWIGEKVTPISLGKIKHIVTKVATQKEWESKEPADLEEMVDHLNDISRGKVLRMKFIAEEYLNKNNEVKTKAVIGMPGDNTEKNPGFAEAVEEGGEYAPISDENTRLVYDPSNKRDYIKLKEDPTPVSNPLETKSAVVEW